jgi:drug/metabolite transporter (DMT)-like permease
VLNYRSAARQQSLSIAAAGIGVVFVIASVVVLVAFGSAAQRVSDALSVAPAAWMVLAPVLASLLPVHGSRPSRLPLMHFAAAVLLTVGLVVGFLAAGSGCRQAYSESPPKSGALSSTRSQTPHLALRPNHRFALE